MSSELRIAARDGQGEVIYDLLTQGVPVDATDGIGWTALMLAAKHCRKLAAQLLLDAGANVNQRNESGNTPLVYAVKSGCTEIVELLLERGADINYRGDKGDRLLKVAHSRQDNRVEALLRQYGAVEAPEVVEEVGGRWTITKPFEGPFLLKINTGGPGMFCRFHYSVSPAPECDEVEITLAADADPTSVKWFPSLRRGIQSGLESARERGRELVGIRIVIQQIEDHPIDTTERVCEFYGCNFVGMSVWNRAVRLPE
jgi:ankyrin repeat protein